jgi:integrase
MRTHLTDLSVRSLKPAEKQFRVWDEKTPGFGVSVSGRTKSWIVMFGDKRQLKVLGRYPDLSLSDARLKAKRLLAEPAAAETASVLLAEAVSLFLSNCEQRTKPRTASDYHRLLHRHFIKALGARSLDTIKTQHVAKIIDALKATPSEQNHAHTAGSIFFAWCVRRGYISTSPMARLQLPSRLKARSRTLSDDELQKVWNAADGTLGAIARLCILLGQRRSEITALKWTWIDREKQTISFPAEVIKNNRAHTIPYGNMAEAVFESTPQLGEYLFPGRDDNPTFAGFSKAKRALDSASGIDGWTLHDLRRTFATNLAALGTPIHVTEKLLNHVSGTTGGLVAVYQRHSYMDEMRAAICAWEKRLSEIIA